MDNKELNAENQPSGSKKDIDRVFEDDEEMRKYSDKNRELGSDSNSFLSGASGRSRSDVMDASPEVHKPVAKRITKIHERKKRVGKRMYRKVEKRRRSMARRQYVRRSPRRKQRKLVRAASVSTIFTRLTGGSSVRVTECKYCGHRTYSRRWGLIKPLFQFLVLPQ